MLAPSCVAAVDVLFNGLTFFTQAQRSALTHFAICPLLDLPLIQSITSLRALAELSSRSGDSTFQRSCPFLLRSIRLHTLLLRQGNIHPTLFRNSRPKFDMEVSQPFQLDDLYHSTKACRSTQIRQRTCVNQLAQVWCFQVPTLMPFPIRAHKQTSFTTGQYSPNFFCLLYTSPSPRDGLLSRMPSSA